MKEEKEKLTKRLEVHMSRDFYKRVKSRAVSEGMTIKKFVIDALITALHQQERHRGRPLD